MLNIDGRIYVTIKVDGNELPYSPNLIERLTMTEGCGALSPAIELILNDFEGSLSKELALTDGNELTVTVGKTPNDLNTQSRHYRVFGLRSLTTANGPRMQVIGIYDAPGYLTGSMRESFKSSTSDVIKTIAARSNLTYYGPSDFNGSKTNDSQVWINIAKSRAMFVQQMSRHGYIDDHSVMFCTLTSLGQLRYLNLNDVIETPKEKIKRQFAHNTFFSEDDKLTTYMVREAKTRSSAGLMNTWQNYGSTRVEHSLDGTRISHDNVQVKTTAEYLPINDVVKKAVDRSRLEYSPMDCGNTHKNFTKAHYQNLKLMALFSEHLSILTDDVTDLQPLDVVIYRQANADPKIPASNSDIYMVIGKTVMVKSATYAERLELVRHNIVEKGATELTTFDGASTSVADSVIPNSDIDPTSNVGADSIPKMQTLNDLTKPTEASLNSLKAATPDVQRSKGFLKPTLKGIHDTLKTIQAIKSGPQMLVAQMRGSMTAMKHYATLGSSYVNQLKHSADNLKSLGQSLNPKNMTSAVRSALMFKKGGSLNAITYNLGVVRQGIQMSSILGPINWGIKSNMNSIRSITGGEKIASDFQMYSNQIIQNTQAMQFHTNGMWNSSVGILHGANVPADNLMTNANANRMTGVMTNLYRAPVSGSSATVSLDTATQDFGDSIMRRTDDRQPPWIAPTATWDYDASCTRARAADPTFDTSLNAAQAAYDSMENDEEAVESREGDAST